MSMINTSQFKKGVYILFKNEPYMIVGTTFVSPGKGSAFYKTKLKSLKNGTQLDFTFKSGEKAEEVFVETHEADYSYFDGSNYVFIEPRTFEQYVVGVMVVGDDKVYLREGKPYRLKFYQGEAVGIVLPKSIVATVAETENAVKGDTVTGAMKPAILDGGLQVQVPLFVKVGDKISVGTEAGEYLSRATD